MSAAYKYAAFLTFCIPTEGDNDADATTPEPVVAGATGPAPVAAPPAVPVKPAGFDQWWGEDEFAADNDGIEALGKHWQQTTTEVRAYVNATLRDKWEALKKDAQKVTADKATARARDTEASPFDEEGGR